MHSWHWQAAEGLPYLTCSLLKSWPHGFFTQQCWPRTPADLVSLLQPDAQVYRVKQVHGKTVLASSEIEASVIQESGEVERPAADGLLTEQAQQAVWVCSADCTPVLIADEVTGQVAAVHSGWRGTAARIVPEAIARLQAQGSRIENILVAMGPAIAGEVYQVSTEVAAEVGASLLPPATADTPKSILQALENIPDSPILPDPEPGKTRLDVRKAIALQLLQLGIEGDRISTAPYCTYQQPDYFFSYRRDQLKKVQWSGIVSTQSS